MNIGIIGAGKIAIKMAETINALDGVTNYAIASRTLEKAADFKNKYGFTKAYGSYKELLEDPKVELVYIATIHSTHYQIMLDCLKYNKPVLCEKCFTTSLKDTIDIYKKFEDANLYVAEAMWTSFMPSRNIIHELLYKDKIIGNIDKMVANFKMDLSKVERVIKKELGGGASMDIGVYPISFIFRTLGYDYKDYKIISLNKNRYGCDMKETLEFSYDNNVKAICNIDAKYKPGNGKVIVYGDKGRMVIDGVNYPRIIKIYNKNYKLIKTIDLTLKYGGFECQVLDSIEAIKNNKLEPDMWTHKESTKVMEVVQKILDK